MRISAKLALPLLLVAAGCATGPYSDFAKAGQTYANALDGALNTAADARVDLSSVTLLEVNATPPQVKEKNDLDRASLVQLQRLRDHAKKLAAYFDALAELASSKAPDDASKAAGDAFDAVQKLGNPLRDSFKSPLSTVTKLVVSGIRSRQLRNELIARQEAIETELATERKVIGILRPSIEDAQTRIHDRGMERIVNIADFPDKEAWIAQRRALLRSGDITAGIDDAASALDKLQKAFDALVTGQLTAPGMKRIANEIELLARGGSK